MRLDTRWLYLGDTLRASDAGVVVYRAFPGAWFLRHGDETIGPFEDRTILRALRVACTPTIDGCEKGPHKLSVTELAPRRRARPGPRWLEIDEAALPPSVTVYDGPALELVSGCCTTFDRMPSIAITPVVGWEPFVASKPAIAGRMRDPWNAHPTESLVFSHEEALERGIVVVDLP